MTSTGLPSVSIIVPTRDRKAIFDRTLAAAVKALEGLEGEIIVVNDSLTSVPEIPPSFTAVRWMQNPGAGVASARNAGAADAKGEVLLFLDNDILITAESLRRTLTFHTEHPHKALNPDWHYPPDLVAQLKGSPFGRFLIRCGMDSFEGWFNHSSWRRNECFPTSALASFHLSLTRADFQKTGGYNASFPHAGFEDYDFPARLRQQGIQQMIDTRFSVWHNEADRLEMENWFQNWENRSISRRTGVTLGYVELTLNYPAWKSSILKCVLVIFPLLKLITDNWPNVQFLDPLFGQLVIAMQASRIYKGYHKRK